MDTNWCTYCDRAITHYSNSLYCSEDCLRAEALRNNPLLGYDWQELVDFPRPAGDRHPIGIAPSVPAPSSSTCALSSSTSTAVPHAIPSARSERPLLFSTSTPSVESLSTAPSFSPALTESFKSCSSSVFSSVHSAQIVTSRLKSCVPSKFNPVTYNQNPLLRSELSCLFGVRDNISID